MKIVVCFTSFSLSFVGGGGGGGGGKVTNGQLILLVAAAATFPVIGIHLQFIIYTAIVVAGEAQQQRQPKTGKSTLP